MSLFLFLSVSEGERSSPEETARPLKFESRFESGNLRKAIQVQSVHVICRGKIQALRRQFKIEK